MSDFDVLGLSFGSDAEEVRKAYFALVRKYPPDRDPVMFKKIRTAYEHLSQGLPEEDENGYAVLKPQDPALSALFDELLQSAEEGEPETVLASAKLLARRFPKAEATRRYYAVYAFEHGFYGISARESLTLIGMFPEKLEYYAIRAKSLAGRGSYKSALLFFEQGYCAGIRGISFESAWATCLRERKRYDEGIEISLRMLRRTRKWYKSSLIKVVDAYRVLMETIREAKKTSGFVFDHMYTGKIQETLDLILRDYAANADALFVYDKDTELGTICGDLCALLPVSNKVTYIGRVCEVFDKSRNPRVGAQIKTLRKAARIARLDRNADMPEHIFSVLMHRPISQNPAALKAYQLDFALCLLLDTGSDLDAMQKIRVILDTRYPDVMQLLRPVFTALQAASDMETLKLTLLHHYKALQAKQVKPEETGTFALAMPQTLDRLPDLTRYEGATDGAACPCGSGRLFKECCQSKVLAARGYLQAPLPF